MWSDIIKKNNVIVTVVTTDPKPLFLEYPQVSRRTGGARISDLSRRTGGARISDLSRRTGEARISDLASN